LTTDPQALARLAFELVSVPSATGEEAALADLVEARCRALPGVAVERLGNALVARVGERDDAVALVGHLDTVPPWEGHEPQLEGTRVIGRGAADMKGGDAAILAVLEHCAGTGDDVVCVFYDREEGPNRENGIHAVLADSQLLRRPAFAFVGEPTGCDIDAGRVGVLNADLVFHGRTAHSARPWEGDSAVLRAVPFLVRAAATPQRPVEVEGLTFHDTLCITQIHGGVARNVVPDRVEIALNVRFAPGREAAVARREIEDLVAGEGELTWIDVSPAAPPRLSEPVLARFLAETGVRVLPKQAWTDVASLQAHGIPAVNYGPGEAHQAHQPGEWVEGDAIARVASTLARFLERISE
jgi:succinyl-diaminopimelate desuccinylase